MDKMICDKVKTIAIKDKRIVHTGLSVEGGKRLENLIARFGGICQSSIGNNTDYLVVDTAYNRGITSKYTKALLLRSEKKNEIIRVIELNDFIKMMDGSDNPNVISEELVSDSVVLDVLNHAKTKNANKTPPAISNELGKGSRVVFGKWNNAPIIWRVLNKTKEGMLLISARSLAAKRFDIKTNNWGSSSLREWLNNDFYNTAFSEKEKAVMVCRKYKCINRKECHEFIESDCVWILSESEFNQYMCSPDSISKRHENELVTVIKDYEQEDCFWFLRSKGAFGNMVGIVIGEKKQTHMDVYVTKRQAYDQLFL